MTEHAPFQLTSESGEVFNPNDVAFVMYSQVLNLLFVKLNSNIARESIQIGVPKRKKNLLQNWLDYHKIYYPPEDFL